MTNSQSNLNSEQHIADILPLIELPERKVPSSERTTFKLNTNPAEAALPKMDFNVNHTISDCFNFKREITTTTTTTTTP